MGSATTQALVATTKALDASSGLDLDVAAELFAASRTLSASSHLSGALADSSAASAARAKVVTDVFGGTFQPVTVALLTTAAQQRWSSASDLVDGIEELAIRTASRAAAGTDIESELFEVTRTIAANPELELALGSRLGDDRAKGALVDTLLTGRVSAATALIVSSAVQQPRGRRIRQILGRSMRLVAAQRARTVATVISAAPISAAQANRLTTALSHRYGSDISLNFVVDPSVVGGLRVEIADDVIDASISARLHDLRQRLAG